MTASGLFRGKKGLSLVVLIVVFAAFAANVFDLREELNILSSPYSDPNDSITAGLVNGSAVAPQPLRLLGFLQPKRPPETPSGYHHLPCGLRAPPPQS